MQASYTFRRSPATRFITLTILVGALMFGGLAGYVLRAIGEPSAASVSTEAQVRQSTWSPSSALYEQGGRPAIVYSTPLTGSATGNVPPGVYEQGGRPPVVYTGQ
jgi:hypothetical protein